jgi:hypothetical protein
LPGGVYNTNYIRQYAACAGIDELAILARYNAFRVSLGDAPGAMQPTLGRTSRLWLRLERLRTVWRRGEVRGGAAKTQRAVST